jgi:glycosyltransferase involved in cell wall biosynthesis
VTFAGFVNQSEMVCAYVAADAAVLPSQTETWGMVVTEAMTCGIPCFVSDQVGCGPDLISPGRTGDTFPVGDINRFADILIRYSAEPERLREMGLNARNRVRGYSVEAAVTGVLEALAAVRN